MLMPMQTTPKKTPHINLFTPQTPTEARLQSMMERWMIVMAEG